MVGPSVSTYIEVAEARYGVGPATEPATEGRSGATAGLAAAASGLSARSGLTSSSRTLCLQAQTPSFKASRE